MKTFYIQLIAWMCLVGAVLGQGVTGAVSDAIPYSSLLIPGGVSYSVSSFSLTQEQNETENSAENTGGKGQLSAVKNIDRGHDGAGDYSRSFRYSSQAETFAGVETRVNMILGILPVPDADADACAPDSKSLHEAKDQSNSSYKGISDGLKEQFSLKGESNPVRSIPYFDEGSIAHGDFHLKFTVKLKTLGRDERYAYKGGGDKRASVDINGLSHTLKVPFEGHDFTLFETYSLPFDYKITDRSLLRELADLHNTGRLDEVLSVTINGSDFELLSSSGMNAFTEMARERRRTPHTMISVDFGIGSEFSPWFVKHRTTFNGKKREITLLDALKAINCKLAENDALPENTFKVDEKGLSSVEDFEMEEFFKGKTEYGEETWGIPVVSLDDRQVLTLSPDVLDTPLKSFSSVKFSFGDAEMLCRYYEKRTLMNDDFGKQMLDLLPDAKKLSGKDRELFYPYAVAASNLGCIEALKRFVEEYEIVLNDNPKDENWNIHLEFVLKGGLRSNQPHCMEYLRQKGGANAEYMLGMFYANGDVVKEDAEKAVEYWRLAADQGHAKAQFNLGTCYLDGTGVEKDEREAVKWYRLAADQGLSYAQHNLGACYAEGTGVEKDEREAVKWYRMAADQGDAAAQYNLGNCYMNGNGVEKDEREAVRWYRMAADQGDADARDVLDRYSD